MTSRSVLSKGSIVALVERSSGAKMNPAQAALLELVGAGRRVQELKGEVRTQAALAVGYEVGPTKTTNMALLVAGPRSGKTALSAALAALRAFTVDLSKYNPGTLIRCAWVGPNLAQSRQGLSYALNTVRSLGLGGLIKSNGQDSFTVQRDKHTIQFLVIRGNAGADPMHGFAYCAVVVTEAQLAAVPATGATPMPIDSVVKEIRKRLIPARNGAPPGLLMLETTAGEAVGPVHAIYEKNFGDPDASVLVFRASTPTMRPDDPELLQLVDDMIRADPSSASDWMAEWSTGGQLGRMFPLELLEHVALDSMPEHPLPDRSRPCVAAADLALVNDASSVAVLRTAADGILELASLKRWQPRRGKPLKPSSVINAVLREAELHGASVLYLDGHLYHSVVEAAAERPSGLQVRPAPTGGPGKREVHETAQELMAARAVRMPRLHELIKELTQIRTERSANGLIKISAPRVRGSHGDMASSVVLGLWAAKQHLVQSQDPRFIPPPPSLALQALGIIDSEGRSVGSQAVIDFEIKGQSAYARPSSSGGQWGGPGGSTFEKGGF